MRNTLESRFGNAVVFPAEKKAERHEGDNFTTVIKDGEGIIIDDKFMLGFKREQLHKNGHTNGIRSKIIHVGDRQTPIFMGKDKKSLEPVVIDSEKYLRPSKFTRLNTKNPVIIIGDREIRITEIFTPHYGYAVKIDSPASFRFERVGHITRIMDMRNIMEKKLGIFGQNVFPK